MTILSAFIYFLLSYSYTPGMVNPNFYVLGPGDTILIVSQSTGMSIKTAVLPDGHVPIYTSWGQGEEHIQVPQYTYNTKTFLVSGVVNASGLTIKEFSDTLSYYSKKLLDKKDSFKVMLIGSRMVSVEISGAVYHPGIYTLPANSTIGDALWRSGGLKGNACFAKIMLVTGNDTTIVNLGTFEHLNSPRDNRSISSVQKIFVPSINEDSSVFIVGDISVPPLSSPIFIPIKSDTLNTTFTLRSRVISVPLSKPQPIYTFLEDIVGKNLNIKILGNKVFVKRNGKIKRVSSLDFEVNPKDSIFIFPLQRGVLVAGEIMRPGTSIPYVEGATVDYYISKAGGKTEYAGPVKILRGFSLINAKRTTIPEDGDVIIVNYSRTKRFAEYVSILQGILTILTLYFAYHK